ncbi:phage tail tape measure protein [Pseudorhizobium banfieldiae]|nr:phage tail tape measure protein [Pseudorhizobium banfieldiae]
MAPARAVAAAGRSLRRNAGDMTVASAAMTIGLTKAGRAIYDMEDVLNEIEGRRFGKRDLFNLADGTEMTRKAFRQSVTDLVTTIDKESPRNAGEIAKAYNQLVQAGMTHEQVHGILPTSVDFAIAGNYDTEEAADKLTNVMTSMQMPMATLEQAQESAKRAADTIAYAANITNSNVEQMTEAFKYAAPSAAALGIDIEQLASMFVIQARRGIKASEAGVSIRAMFTRMVRPTKMAAAALANYNIDLADYLERSKEISSGDVVNALQVGGLDARGATAEIDKILATSESTAVKVRQITEAITKSVGDNSTMSAEVISEAVREVMYSFGENLDVERLIEDMQKANIAVSDFFKIFDVRQGARTLSLFSDDLGRWIDNIRQNAGGFSEAMSDVRMQGVVGAVARMDSALFGVLRAAADSGVLDTVTNGLEKFAAALNNLAKVNPEALEIGTYAVMATAALAPLGFALSGIATVAALVVNPLAWVAGGLAYLAYLNFDNLMIWAKNFGPALQESLGPRTLNAIEKAKELLGSIFKTHEFDAAAAGKAHGEGFAAFIESEVVAMEHNIQQFQDLWSRMKGGWFNFEEWWNGLVTDFHTGLDRFIAESKDGFVRMKNDLIAEGQQLYDAGLQMIQSLWDGAVAKFEEFMGWVRGIPGRIRAAIGSITIDNAINFVTGGNEPVAVPNIQGSNDNGIDGARAKGGPVKKGLTYLVGEEGPEPFTPTQDGHITSNRDWQSGRSGGGSSRVIQMTNHFHLKGGATKDDAKTIIDELDRLLGRAEQTAFGGMKYGET